MDWLRLWRIIIYRTKGSLLPRSEVGAEPIGYLSSVMGLDDIGMNNLPCRAGYRSTIVCAGDYEKNERWLLRGCAVCSSVLVAIIRRDEESASSHDARRPRRRAGWRDMITSYLICPAHSGGPGPVFKFPMYKVTPLTRLEAMPT